MLLFKYPRSSKTILQKLLTLQFQTTPMPEVQNLSFPIGKALVRQSATISSVMMQLRVTSLRCTLSLAK